MSPLRLHPSLDRGDGDGIQVQTPRYKSTLKALNWRSTLCDGGDTARAMPNRRRHFDVNTVRASRSNHTEVFRHFTSTDCGENMQQTFIPVRRFKKNTAGRDFVVGDLHGCFSRLAKELELRRYDPSRDRLFAVGDLVDRGIESPAVLEFVDRYRIQSVRGNHEDTIVRWHRYGGKNASIRSTGGEWLFDMVYDKAALDDIVTYMAALPYAIEIETDDGLVGIVHANVPTQSWPKMVQALEQEDRNGPVRRKVIWDRSRWIAGKTAGFISMRRAFAQLCQRFAPGWLDPGSRIDGVAAVIVGHTPVREPMVRGNVINVDTGLVYGGALTLLRLDEIPMLLNRATREQPAFGRSKGYPAGSGA
ncbi:metallophosphoesterase [Paraburkholderia sp. BL25I1N1]|uniref:metallophosphoesterase n=1 Tax=Paraburkholderia sp. BL25I1N1 TaxID=1938804 RepID=UPI000D082477|nr:metallophosphoesterase [Paraburkholderia sp. BL25I1N1]